MENGLEVQLYEDELLSAVISDGLWATKGHGEDNDVITAFSCLMASEEHANNEVPTPICQYKNPNKYSLAAAQVMPSVHTEMVGGGGGYMVRDTNYSIQSDATSVTRGLVFVPREGPAAYTNGNGYVETMGNSNVLTAELQRLHDQPDPNSWYYPAFPTNFVMQSPLRGGVKSGGDQISGGQRVSGKSHAQMACDIMSCCVRAQTVPSVSASALASRPVRVDSSTVVTAASMPTSAPPSCRMDLESSLVYNGLMGLTRTEYLVSSKEKFVDQLPRPPPYSEVGHLITQGTPFGLHDMDSPMPMNPQGHSMGPIDYELEELVKREKKKLRNRIASSKCRKRKLEREARLQDHVKVLKGKNVELGRTLITLRAQIGELKLRMSKHASDGCQIVSIES